MHVENGPKNDESKNDGPKNDKPKKYLDYPTIEERIEMLNQDEPILIILKDSSIRRWTKVFLFSSLFLSILLLYISVLP